MKNFMTLEGNLGGKPTAITTKTTKFLVLSVAQNRPSKEKELVAEWYEVTVFNKGLIERCQSLSKGDFVQITGHLRTISKTFESKNLSMIKLVATQVQKITKLKKTTAIDLPQFDSAEEVNL